MVESVVEVASGDLLVATVEKTFLEKFQNTPLMVKAPGRINLIGEHTDYNNGFVLPAAVGQCLYFGIAASGDDQCNLIALDMDEKYSFDLNNCSPDPEGWQNYIKGVVAEIQKSGRVLKGFNLVFSGNVPAGSGMSSSAALECGVCYAINELFGLGIPKLEMVKMSQMAEHNYAGVKCGIMDQFASMMGLKDHALLLDCKTLNYEHFEIDLNGYALLLCNSNVTHSLASSEYNVRREQCERGVATLQSRYPEITSLREATLEQLYDLQDQIETDVFLRCKYVIEENMRVQSFTLALKEDIVAAGQLLKKAQFAMKYEYEITCPEIDFMAEFANSHETVLGSRMMGGGFGGCTLNLIKSGKEDQFIDQLNEQYAMHFGKKITPIKVDISDGVGKL